MIFIGTIIGFLLAVAIVVILYFTLLNKLVCGGGRRLYNCPTGNVSVCMNPDDAGDYPKHCNTWNKSSDMRSNLKIGPGDGITVNHVTPNQEANDLDGCKSCLSEYGDTAYWNNRSENGFQCNSRYKSNASVVEGDLVAYNSSKGPSFSFPCTALGRVGKF